jgi:hypothetical protein
MSQCGEEKRIISDYEKSVNDLAKKNSSFQFENKGADHARIVVAAILKNATHTVFMFSGQLNSDVVDNDEFIQTLKTFLNNREITFKLLLEEIPSGENKSDALKLVLSASENAHVIVKKITDDSKEYLKEFGHFIVADTKAYRYETDLQGYKALCCFNDESISTRLKEVFSNAFENSEYYLCDS